MVKKFALVFVVVLAFIFVSYEVVHAQTIRSGANSNISSAEVINSSAYLTGQNLDISGTINGDLYCAAQSVTISGTINGDIICAAQTMTITGKVDGNIRVAAQTLTYSGKVTRNATVFAQSVILTNTAIIAGDVNGGASAFTLNSGATIARDLTFGASDMFINGVIGRDAKLAVEQLTIGGQAKIGGKVEYTSSKNAVTQTGATVAGTTTRLEPSQNDSSFSFGGGFAFSLLFAVFSFGSFLVIALALVLIWPRLFKDAALATRKSPWVTLLIGFLASIAAPMVLIALALTIFGIPLAFIAGLAWLLIVLLSGPFAAYIIGDFVLKNQNSVIKMLVGAALLVVICLIPFVGFFATGIAMFVGIGCIINLISKSTSKPKY